MIQRTYPGKGKKCGRFLSNLYVDGHTLCTKCRGKDCNQTTHVLNVRDGQNPSGWCTVPEEVSRRERHLLRIRHSQNFHTDLPQVKRRWLPVKKKPCPVRRPVRRQTGTAAPVRCRPSSLFPAPCPFRRPGPVQCLIRSLPTEKPSQSSLKKPCPVSRYRSDA